MNDDEVGYTNHTGFGGLIGQVSTGRQGFANAATQVVAATASEAIAEAGLDWTVSKRPLWFTGKSNGSKPKKVDNAFAMVKDDDEQYLGTVGRQYHAIQNVEAFAWADMVPGQYVAGGAMRTNRNVYLVKKMDEFNAAGDPTTMYIILRSSHDGTKSLSAVISPVRLYCMNAMPLALKRAVGRFSVRHVTTFQEKLEQAAQVTGLVSSYKLEFQKAADEMAAVKLTRESAEAILTKAMPGRTELIAGVLGNLTASSTIGDDQRETGWGLLNATTEYLEWMRETNTPAHALQANLDGQGARIRNAVARQLQAVAV